MTSPTDTDIEDNPDIEILLGLRKRRIEARHFRGTDMRSSQSSEAAAYYFKIEKVPEILGQNEANKECFTPMLMVLGPYHHHREKEEAKYKRGKDLKIALMKNFFNDDASSIVEHFKKVEGVLKFQARAFYNWEKIAFIPDALEFAAMMFVDGCALLRFIHCAQHDGGWGAVDLKYYEMFPIIHDLFLLENQVPFPVLALFMGENEIKGMFNKFIKEVRRTRDDQFKPSWPLGILLGEDKKNPKKQIQLPQARGDEEEAHERSSNKPPPTHLLHMLWEFYVPDDDQPPKSENTAKNELDDWYTYRSIKELKAAGIFFSRSKTSKMTDVKYVPLPCHLPISYLFLPPIIVDDLTKSFLLNLASYEMSTNRPNRYPVSSYMCFLDSLVDNEQDVAELRSSGVILNCLGSDQEVATLFNDVAKYLVSDASVYRLVQTQIEKHYGSTFKIWMAEALYTHFRTPWTFLAFIGAILALVLTFIQTLKP